MAKPSKDRIVAALLERHGQTYAAELSINLERGTPSALFRWLCAAILLSARINAEAAIQAARALAEEGWTTAEKMAAATWEQRTRTLNRAGYARYDESTSRMLGNTAEMLLEKYQGDLRRLRDAAERDPGRERALLRECKGIGEVGADIFCREAQIAWDELFPFADRRALRAASRSMTAPSNSPAEWLAETTPACLPRWCAPGLLTNLTNCCTSRAANLRAKRIRPPPTRAARSPPSAANQNRRLAAAVACGRCHARYLRAASSLRLRAVRRPALPSGRRAVKVRPRICVLTGDPRLPDLTKRDHRYNDEDFVTHRAMREAFESFQGYRFAFEDDHSTLLERFSQNPPDLVINFCDTGFRNVATQELHVPALLELLGIPYSGASPACMAYCYDKQIVRLLAQAIGVPVPHEVYLAADQSPVTLPEFYPALIKPNQADGSVGIRQDAVVRSRAEALSYIAWVRSELPGRALLVQEYLPGPEYGVGLIGNPETELVALPALEVDFSRLPEGLNPILSYESKALPDSPYWTEIKFGRAAADEATLARIAGHARGLFARLGCRDYARFDFRCEADGEPKLMEVNPNPAWANDGKLAFMAGFAGIAYRDMLKMILDAALRRLDRRRTGRRGP